VIAVPSAECRRDEHEPAQTQLRIGKEIGDGGEYRAEQDTAADALHTACNDGKQHAARESA
jgi:hypothetical protein